MRLEEEKIENVVNRKKERWEEKIDKEKLKEILALITAKARELQGEKAVKFSGKELLQEIGVQVNDIKPSTIRTKVDVVIRKLGKELGIWNSKFTLKQRETNYDSICYVMLKKKYTKR